MSWSNRLTAWSPLHEYRLSTKDEATPFVMAWPVMPRAAIEFARELIEANSEPDRRFIEFCVKLGASPLELAKTRCAEYDDDFGGESGFPAPPDFEYLREPFEEFFAEKPFALTLTLDLQWEPGKPGVSMNLEPQEQLTFDVDDVTGLAIRHLQRDRPFMEPHQWADFFARAQHPHLNPRTRPDEPFIERLIRYDRSAGYILQAPCFVQVSAEQYRHLLRVLKWGGPEL